MAELKATIAAAAELKATIGAGKINVNDYVLTVEEIEGGCKVKIVRGSQTQEVVIPDYSADEEARQAAEASRVTAESSRLSAEESRQSAESSRITAEQARESAEKERASAELARASTEASRQSAETARESAESLRVGAEKERVGAESARAAAESARATAEDARKAAETARASAETDRAAAETTRQSNETARQSAESKRETDSAAAVSAANTAASNAQSIADTVQEKLDAGELKGEKGDKGFSPSASVAQTDTGAMVTVTDESGTTTAELKNVLCDDSTLSTVTPWSSRHTVDTLCPEVTVSGNPVEINGAMSGYPMTVEASWEPAQSGEGAPALDNIRPFVARDSVTVTHNDVSNTLTLPQSVYGGSVDDKGSGKITWKIADVASFVGDESWNNWGVSVPGGGYTGFFTYTLKGIDATNIAFVGARNANEKFTHCEHGFVYTDKKTCAGFIRTSVNPFSCYFAMSVPASVLEDTSTSAALNASFVKWLTAQKAAGTPVQVAFPVITPDTFDVASVAYTAQENNTLSTDADKLTVTTRESPLTTFTKLTDRIAALEAAATSIEEA